MSSHRGVWGGPKSGGWVSSNVLRPPYQHSPAPTPSMNVLWQGVCLRCDPSPSSCLTDGQAVSVWVGVPTFVQTPGLTSCSHAYSSLSVLEALCTGGQHSTGAGKACGLCLSASPQGVYSTTEGPVIWPHVYPSEARPCPRWGRRGGPPAPAGQGCRVHMCASVGVEGCGPARTPACFSLQSQRRTLSFDWVGSSAL